MARIERFDSVTIRVPTPSGKAFVQIFERESGKIEEIFMHIGKQGSEINAYCYALAQMTCRFIQEGKTINDVISILQGISSDRSARVSGGVTVRSGPEALAIALMRYRTTLKPTSPIMDEGDRRAPVLMNAR